MTAATSAEQEVLNVVARHSEARQIIVFAPSFSWDDKVFQRPQYLARALARRGALVFYMQPDRSWPLLFSEVEERLVVCQTPAEAFRVASNAFVYVLAWNIPLLAYFEAPRVIYDYSSDISAFQGDPQRLQRDHGDYLYRADLVLTASEKLHRQAASLRTDCLLCPNGADANAFTESCPTPQDLVPILADGKPVIGFHGTMSPWVDYELLKTLAARRPEYSFVLIGSDKDQLLQASGLLELSNVYSLGLKPYSEMPSYVSRFQAGLIPFKVNEITNAASPIKLFEYFAAGKPVVVSPMEESQRYPDALIAATSEEWLEKIDQALQQANDAEYVKHLQVIGQQNSWETRADSILERLDTLRAVPRAVPWHTRFQPRNPRLQQLFRLLGRVGKVWRMSGFTGVIKGIYYKLYNRFAHLRRSGLFRLPRSLDDTYIVEDNSQAVLYTDDPTLLPDYWPRHEIASDGSHPMPKVSMISTTFNEKAHIEVWLESVFSQSVMPDEIVIVDGGSTDGTLDVLSSYAEKSPAPLRVIVENGANISRGRNAAVENARNEIIAVTDCGCRLEKGWLENLVAPFRLEPRTETVAGWYHALDRRDRILPYKAWPTLAEVDPQTFVPSSRSIAFTKEAWRKAGGYPEWLTLTGEDTYFALELKRFCSHWAFVPSAIVDWYGPETWRELWKKAFYWSSGDGESGYNAWLFRKTAIRLFAGMLGLIVGFFLLGFLLKMFFHLEALAAWGGGALVMALIALARFGLLSKIPPQTVFGNFGLRIAQLAGFWSGARRKAMVDQRRLAHTKGLCFILAGVPIDDTGGGARCSQIALELLRQNYWVVYIHRYPSWESSGAVLRIAHPNLFTYILGEFHWSDFMRRFGGLLEDRPMFTLIDFPSPEFLPFVREMREKGGKILYDMIDDWDSSLGNWGFSPSIEREMIRISDELIATAPVLKEKLETIGQRPALLLPNAVNSRLFNPDRQYQRPADLPQADWIAAYIGALWGDWFDWDLLKAIADRYPQAAVIVIGDYRGQCTTPPPNLHFLGLKPQSSLPAYLFHTDVALIPWKVNPITQATSPLKLYEYLAMHRPVVTPDLMPLHNIPGVTLAKSFDDFVALVDSVRHIPFEHEKVDHFVRLNNWQGRVDQMLDFTGSIENG